MHPTAAQRETLATLEDKETDTVRYRVVGSEPLAGTLLLRVEHDFRLTPDGEKRVMA